MTNEQMPLANLTEAAPDTACESPTANPEVYSAEPHLVGEQVKALEDYVLNALDQNTGAGHFSTAVKRMKALSEQAGGSLELGEIAISAAALGSLSRSPEAFRQSAATLTDKIIALGMPKKHASVLIEMQQSHNSRPEALSIGETLKSRLSYLDKCKKHGEDTSQARVAFMASSLAATQNVSLRLAILKQLEV